MRLFVITLLLALLVVPALAQDDHGIPDISGAPLMFAATLHMDYGPDGPDDASMAALGQHIAYLRQLYAEGKLLLAGPFDDMSGSGLVVYTVDSLEEAQAIVAADPSVAAGAMQLVDLRPWRVPFSEEFMDDDEDDDEDEDEDEGMPPMAEGQVVHLEFHSADLDRSNQFYTDLFGWTLSQPWEGVEYLLFMDGPNKLGGGFMAMPESAGGAVTYIYTEDIEAKLAEIVAAGGTLVKPKEEIPGVGFYAIFADPDGNTLGLFSEH